MHFKYGMVDVMMSGQVEDDMKPICASHKVDFFALVSEARGYRKTTSGIVDSLSRSAAPRKCRPLPLNILC